MDGRTLQQQARYDETWKSGLAGGKEQRGDLATNVAFLDRSGLIRAGLDVLELGCGIGSIVHELAGRGCRAVGSDISEVAVRYGREKYPGLRLEVQPAEELPYADASFDAVLSFDVLEHLHDVDRHLDEVCRVLRGGGHYLLQTPNKWTNIAFETMATRSLRWREYHPSLHTPGQLRRRLGRHGLAARFVKMNALNEFRMAKLRKVLGPLARLAGVVNFERLPLSMQTNLYVIAQKE